MKTYSEFSPSGFDVAGLGLEDRQDWLVAPVTINRDSNILEESNWKIVKDAIFGAEPIDYRNDGPDAEIHEFGHWACGWFRICLVRPDSKAAEMAASWEAALSDYPIACENDYSEKQRQAGLEYWKCMSLRERVKLLSRYAANIFAARRDMPPDNEKVWSYLTERE